MDGKKFMYCLTMGLLKTVTALPLRMLYGISDLGAFILRDVVKYRRKIVASNLRRAFPEASPEDLKKWEREFYRHLCDIFVEAAKLANISDKEMLRRMEVVNAELMNEALDNNQPVVLFLGHYGNWEWVTSITLHITERRTIMSEIYHPLRNKVMDKVMLKLRSRFGTENIPMSRAVRRLLEIRRDGGNFICGFISDQRPFTKELKHWTDFMGIDTPYVCGGELIGVKTGARFLYIDMEPLRRGHYRMTLKEMKPDPEDKEENPYSRLYLRMLEETIRRNPPYWLWSHNRWKRKREHGG